MRCRILNALLEENDCYCIELCCTYKVYEPLEMNLVVLMERDSEITALNHIILINFLMVHSFSNLLTYIIISNSNTYLFQSNHAWFWKHRNNINI